MTTENEDELKKFSALAGEWYLANGSFEILRKMNKLRVQYILSQDDIVGKTILDVGCGGGILAEELANLGAVVTAIDPCVENIEAAIKNSQGEVTYLATSLDKYVEQGKKFDNICIMEVIEHVNDPEKFIAFCARVLAPGGKIFFSTLNKTIKSFVFGIVAAEYLLKLVPRNTHSWKKFFRPSTLNRIFSSADLEIVDLKGLTYNILSDSWKLDQDISVNYLGFATSR